MFDGTPYKDELKRRLASVTSLIDAAHVLPLPIGGEASPAAGAPEPDVSRETRGVAIVLLFAAYENLLKSLCRGLLQKTASLRVGNRRLRPGLQLFAIYPRLQSINELPAHRIWRDKGRELIDLMRETRSCSVDVALFPNDGSFMKTSQVQVFCELFDLGDPGTVLKEVWGRLDAIVAQRNLIAHGAQTPEEVGKGYTVQEIRHLVHLWDSRWCDFVDHISTKASLRDFYRERR